MQLGQRKKLEIRPLTPWPRTRRRSPTSEPVASGVAREGLASRAHLFLYPACPERFIQGTPRRVGVGQQLLDLLDFAPRLDQPDLLTASASRSRTKWSPTSQPVASGVAREGLASRAHLFLYAAGPERSSKAHRVVAALASNFLTSWILLRAWTNPTSSRPLRAAQEQSSGLTRSSEATVEESRAVPVWGPAGDILQLRSLLSSARSTDRRPPKYRISTRRRTS